MNTIFTLDDEEELTDKLNMDDLYETKRQHDMNKLNVYNKVLNRIHAKIKLTSRQKINEQYCWFLVPEVMIGVPRYDSGSCIAYLVDKLKTNGFNTCYTHPNLLFISWKHWVPAYVRQEFKKKTGLSIDGYGNKVDTTKEASKKSNDPNDLMIKKNDTALTIKKDDKEYKDINSYKPTGKLIYNNDIIKRIEDKFT